MRKRPGKHPDKRPYRLKRRAEQQDKTRVRIVEAAMALHEELGPRNTTISAIAERAGVQRLTVYRHFPDAHGLLVACSSHWLALHPPPDPADWQAIDNPGARLRTAVARLYGYYRRTEKMWRGSYRDEDAVPALKATMEAPRDYLRRIRDDLVAAWAPSPEANRTVSAVIGHCLQFSSWESLDREGLTDAEMADAIAQWLEGICSYRPGRRLTSTRADRRRASG
ncbi:MAG: TetR/AcrR family transcriptional regulator [Burkholderiales bacterium]